MKHTNGDWWGNAHKLVYRPANIQRKAPRNLVKLTYPDKAIVECPIRSELVYPGYWTPMTKSLAIQIHQVEIVSASAISHVAITVRVVVIKALDFEVPDQRLIRPQGTHTNPITKRHAYYFA